MAIEIVTPELGKTKKATKDLIISSLTYDYPLTLAKLTNTIKRKYAASVTFQGVRKAVLQLEENGVISKDKKQYSLTKEWIQKLREFVESLHESYFTEKTGIQNIEAIGEDIKVYTFDNLIDLDKFWNLIIGTWFDKDKGNTKFYIQQSGHTWYVLGQLGEETAILDKMRKYNIQFYTLVTGKTFLDTWTKKYYADQGFFYTTSKGDTTKYFAVYGDNIIQTEYPKTLAIEIDQIYAKAKNFESFEVAKLIQILRKKVELQLLVMKNPLIAEQLRNAVLKNFNV